MALLKLVKWIGALALIAGIGMALWGLSAPLGVWLGLWDFRYGFDILRKAHDLAIWVAPGIAIVALAIFTMGFKFTGQRFKTLAVFVLCSAGIGSLSYFIPEAFRAPDGQSYPPIHDITTDTLNPPEFVEVLPLRANSPNSAIYGRSEGMTPEELARLQQQAYPDIQPWRTSEPRQIVFDRALKTVNELGWELVSQAPAEGRIEATDTTFWFRFKDDIVIIVAEENGETVVNARSVSRVGRGDVGANAKRLREFFVLLSEQQ